MRIVHFFFKITKNYMVELDLMNSIYKDSFKIEVPIKNNINQSYVLGLELNQYLNLDFPISEKYFVLSDKDVFVIYKLVWYEKYLLKLLIDSWKLDYNVIKEKFKRKNKEKLIEIFKDDYNLNKTLTELTEYVFCDHYSFWIYNTHTEYFTLHSSSFTPKYSYKKNDKDSDYNRILSKESWLFEEFDSSSNTNSELNDIKSINRIRVKLITDESQPTIEAVFTIFSKNSDYHFRKDTVKLFQNIISLKLSKTFYPYINKMNYLMDFITKSYSFGKFESHIQNCVTNITKTLNWEAASIFLIDSTNEVLKLKALSDKGERVVDANVLYHMIKDKDSLTIKSLDKLLTFSYDIDNDLNNTHVFDEKCEHKSTNWIGISLRHSNNNTIGVLRVKNKVSESNDIEHFNQIDITILLNIASIISYQYELESNYIKEHLEKEKELLKKTKENYNLNTFIKTFRHEITSPLIVVTQASGFIKSTLVSERVLKNLEMTPKAINNILDDLSMVGDRMGFVATSLTLNASDLVREIKTCLVFQDIVAPIKAFAIRYAYNRNKNLKIDFERLKITPVKCDPIAASMVFHILIDNAIKYANEKTDINVYGKEVLGFSIIVVENYGLKIYEDEKDRIFKQFERGMEAEYEDIEGSGIGLFLAKQIMDKLEGKIILTNFDNPVRFELYFKNINK